MKTFLLVLLVAVRAAATEAPLTEEGFVARALASGLEARTIDAERELARADRKGAGLWPNPYLEWERQPNPTNDAVVGSQHVLVASIPLVLSGRLGLERDAADAQVAAAEANRVRARSGLRRDATAAFASLLSLRERSAVLASSLEQLERQSRIIEIRQKAGEAAGYDSTRIALERAAIDDRLQQLQLDEKRARAVAATLLGVPVLPELATSYDRSTDDAPAPAALEAELEHRRADLQAARWEEEGARLARKAAGRRWIPDPSLTAGAFYLEGALPGEELGYVVGLSVPLPLFERGQGFRARAEASRALSNARLEQQLLEAKVSLREAAEGVVLRRERLRRHEEEVVARAARLRTIASAGYRGGGSDLLALMDAERVARDAELHAINLRLELKLAESELAFISGAYDATQERVK